MTIFEIWGACIVGMIGIVASVICIMIIIHIILSRKGFRGKSNKSPKLT